MSPDLGSNAGIVEDMYREFVEHPDSVSEAWREFFADYVPREATGPVPVVTSDGTPIFPVTCSDGEILALAPHQAGTAPTPGWYHELPPQQHRRCKQQHEGRRRSHHVVVGAARVKRTGARGTASGRLHDRQMSGSASPSSMPFLMAR